MMILIKNFCFLNSKIKNTLKKLKLFKAFFPLSVEIRALKRKPLLSSKLYLQT